MIDRFIPKFISNNPDITTRKYLSTVGKKLFMGIRYKEALDI